VGRGVKGARRTRVGSGLLPQLNKLPSRLTTTCNSRATEGGVKPPTLLIVVFVGVSNGGVGGTHTGIQDLEHLSKLYIKYKDAR